MPEVNNYIFQPLADIAKVNLIHFLTTPTPAESVGWYNSSYLIDIDNLEKVIKDSIY